MNLKICPICRSLYPNDMEVCSCCNETLIDNNIYKKWNDKQKNEYMQKYKSKYNEQRSTVKINVTSLPSQPKSQPEQNIPKCPTCQSTNIEKISDIKKATGFWTVGVFSKNFGKTYHCKNCDYRW